MFNPQANKSFGFGGTAGFGQSTAFGQPQTSVFGQTSTFGSTTTQQSGGLFGGTQPTGLFGTTNTAFGQPQPQQQGFAFGTTQPTSQSSMFGQTQPSAGFGVTSFSSQPRPGGFGSFGATSAAQPSTGMFGQQTTTPSTSLFGSNTTQSGGLFGSTATGFVTVPVGTTVKFKPLTGTDTMMKNGTSTNINTQHQCITCMKEYETKSLEELRLEDYVANRKTGTSTAVFGATSQPNTSGLFGTTAAAPSTGFAFGNTQQRPLFGGATSSFGVAPAQPASTFGAGTTSFGAPVGNTTSVFGTTPTTNTGVGGSFFSKSAFGGFPAATGATTQTTAASTFGAKPFGQTNTFGGGFGTNTTVNPTQPKAGLSFGTNSSFNSFANPATSGAFSFSNATTPATTSLFSKPAATGFGAATGGFSFAPTSTATTFGVTNNNNNQNKGFGTFGSPATSVFPTSNMFNQANSFAAPSAGVNPLQTNFSSSIPDAAMMSRIQQLVMMTTSPHGDSSLFKGYLKKDQLKPTSMASQKAVLAQVSVKVTNPPSDKLKVKPINGLIPKHSLFSGLEDGEVSAFNAQSPKRFTIKPKSPPAGSLGISIFEASAREHLNQTIEDDEAVGSGRIDPQTTPLQSTPYHHPTVHGKTSMPNVNPLDAVQEEAESSFHLAGERSIFVEENNKENENGVGVTLTREGYYTIPPLATLDRDINGECWQNNFTIGRKGYGSVMFPGKLNVANMNLDRDIVLQRKEITVYPIEEQKPPLGHGMNRKAEVTLEYTYPLKKADRVAMTDPEELRASKFKEKLERHTIRMGATFLEYDERTGKWVFQVNHFSRYGLDDDEDEGSMPTSPVLQQTKPKPVVVMAASGKGAIPAEEEMLASADMRMEPTDMDVFSPASFQVCKGFNIESHLLQGMKASLFPMDDMEEEVMDKENYYVRAPPEVKEKKMKMSPLADTVNFELRKPPSRMKTANIVAKGNEDFLAKFDKIASVVEQSDPLEDMRVVHSAAKFAFIKVPQELSIFSKYNEFFVNELSSMNRLRTRVGLSSSWKMCRPDKRQSKKATLNIMINQGFTKSAGVVEEQIVFKGETDGITELLSVQLNSSDLTFAQNGMPCFAPRKGVALLNHHVKRIEDDVGRPLLETELYNVLTLCEALWGDSIPECSDSIEVECARKRALSKWITKVTADVVANERDNCENHLHVILCLLGGHQIMAACEEASRNSDYNLAGIISQAGHNMTVKQICQMMCAEWIETRKDQKIDEDRLKVYSLMAGVAHWTTSDGGDMNVFSGLDWLRCLALHLWYICPSTMTISEVLQEYDLASESYATKPEVKHGVDGLASGEDPLHVCYQLIRLYSDSSLSLEKMLAPDTIMSIHSQLEYRNCWVLAVVLQSLGYRVHCINQLHHNLSCELEAIGLWQWSIFALLHHSDPVARHKAVYDVLCRHVSPSVQLNTEEAFVVGSLKVPKRVVLRAKALRAGYLGLHVNQVRLFTLAEDFNQAHQLVVSQLAVKSLVNEQYQFLGHILQALAAGQVKIVDWNCRGKVYMNYVVLCGTLDEVLRHKDDERRVERVIEASNLEGVLASLSTSIARLPRQTLEERLCQIEMAKKTFTAYKHLLTMRSLQDPTLKNCVVKTIFSLLTKLPLPDDIRATEFKTLCLEYPKYLPNEV